MGRRRKDLLTKSEKQKSNNLKKFGNTLTMSGYYIPREEIYLEFPNMEQGSNDLVNLVSPEIIRAAQSLTPQQLVALIPVSMEQRSNDFVKLI